MLSSSPPTLLEPLVEPLARVMFGPTPVMADVADAVAPAASIATAIDVVLAASFVAAAAKVFDKDI